MVLQFVVLPFMVLQFVVLPFMVLHFMVLHFVVLPFMVLQFTVRHMGCCGIGRCLGIGCIWGFGLSMRGMMPRTWRSGLRFRGGAGFL
jgi:hypothetical protein